MSSPDLRAELCGIELRNPLVNGSGTLDALAAGTLGLGAFVTKTVTLHPREGNPPPRIAEACRVLGQIRVGSLTIVESGHRHTFGAGAPAATIELHDSSFWRMVMRGSRGLAESYIEGAGTRPTSSR